jgi:hypothetical protein
MITGGSSMPVLSVRRSGDDLQSAAAVRAVFNVNVDVEDPFKQPVGIRPLSNSPPKRGRESESCGSHPYFFCIAAKTRFGVNGPS